MTEQKEKSVKFSITISSRCNDVLTEFVKVAGSTKSGFIASALEDQIDVLVELTASLKKSKDMIASKAAKKASKRASIV
jgi:hypothetical protein